MSKIVMSVFLFCILSSQRSLHQCWAATSRRMTSTLWRALVIRRQLFMKLYIDHSGEPTCNDVSLQNVFSYTNSKSWCDFEFCWPHKWGIAIKSFLHFSIQDVPQGMCDNVFLWCQGGGPLVKNIYMHKKLKSCDRWN